MNSNVSGYALQEAWPKEKLTAFSTLLESISMPFFGRTEGKLRFLSTLLDKHSLSCKTTSLQEDRHVDYSYADYSFCRSIKLVFPSHLFCASHFRHFICWETLCVHDRMQGQNCRIPFLCQNYWLTWITQSNVVNQRKSSRVSLLQSILEELSRLFNQLELLQICLHSLSPMFVVV